ncbi:MAG: ABC transporter substrate-binding protein [Rhizobiales bacterium]|nr:ABC transporter substrate-binding protein [Hyphomicrobiales bacterium]
MLTVRNTIAFLLLSLFVGAAAPAYAAGPEDLVKSMASEVTASVRSLPPGSNGVNPKLTAIIERDLVPRFDFTRISQIAMGRNWMKASQAEQRQITSEFSHLLIRTYSNAINNLRDLDVVVRSTRSNVRTQMVGRGSPSSIDYSLSNATGSWKVYDVQVEGISLVAAYRDEFTGLVSSDGVAGVIAALKKKNAK